jgi:hypothetical protein
MKLSKQKLKQIIKEELNEISKKQRSHEERLAQQMAQKKEKKLEAEHIRQQLGSGWEVIVRMLEGRYQITVHTVSTGGPASDEQAEMEEIASNLENEYEGVEIKVEWDYAEEGPAYILYLPTQEEAEVYWDDYDLENDLADWQNATYDGGSWRREY